MATLALLGGTPLRTTPFPRHPIVGDEEKQAVLDVLERGELSTFIAAPGRYFLGGTKIREFERRFAEYHDVKYAVAFNSATAALHAAVVAVGVQPGQEVIATPYSFTSSATCALMHNAIPVFADIEDDIFCLDPRSVERAVSPLTRAIIPVHLFGHPADMDGIMAIARRHGLKVIEDCAQAPGARYKGRIAGTIADCGIFSFTENKNVTTGEGGMLITNDEAIAEAARMVRNHGEMVVEGQKVRTYSPSILGWNYRLTEMAAALGIVQFGRMDTLNGERQRLADYLTSKLSGIPGLTPPVVRPSCTHAFYIYAMKYDAARTGIPRATFVKALAAEGIPFGAGYVPPLYLTPIYHESRPFAFQHYTGTARYDKGLCPVTERLYESDLIQTQIARPPATVEDMNDVVDAIHKVLDGRAALGAAGA
jgi:dTDP-4-amino-4,6-dideoxygalactose transaminase